MIRSVILVWAPCFLILKCCNFLCNFTDTLITRINFYRIKYLIHLNSCNAFVHNLSRTNLICGSGYYPTSQIMIRTGEIMDKSIARIQMYQVLDTVKIDTSNKSVCEITEEIAAL